MASKGFLLPGKTLERVKESHPAVYPEWINLRCPGRGQREKLTGASLHNILKTPRFPNVPRNALFRFCSLKFSALGGEGRFWASSLSSVFLSATQRLPLYDVTSPLSEEIPISPGSRNSIWSLHFGAVLPGRLPWAASGPFGSVSLSLSLSFSLRHKDCLFMT